MKSCAQWGSTTSAQTDDPNCDCCMCMRRREDRKGRKVATGSDTGDTGADNQLGETS